MRCLGSDDQLYNIEWIFVKEPKHRFKKKKIN